MNRDSISKLVLILSIFTSGFVAHATYQCCNNDYTFYNKFFAVDYLYWQASEDQLQYAVQVPGGMTEFGFLGASQILIENQKFKANSGVRLTAGYSWCDNWNTRFVWTHFNKCSFATVQGAANSIIAIALFQLVDNPIGSGATSDWCIKFDTFDWELAKEWDFCDSLNLRPFVGIKGAIINQQQDIAYQGLSGFTASVVRHNNFSAIGPRAGIDVRWNMFCNLNLIGTCAGALLYGKLNANARNVIVTPTNVFVPELVDNKHRLRPTMQILLGLSWDKPLCDAVLFELGVAYEVQYWWNQWQTVIGLSSVVPNWAPGDFMTQGLTLRFGISF